MDEERFQYLKDLDQKLKIQRPIDDERRQDFENFLEAFPGSHEHWIQYIKEENAAGNTEAVDRLFYRCLPTVPDVSLFQFYLNIISHRDGVTSEIIKNAYEYALSKVGLDIKAYPLYSSYLEFLDHVRTTMVNAEMEIPRSVYHRALKVPLEDGNNLHNMYRKFETERAPSVCKSFIKEYDQHFKITNDVYLKKAPRAATLKCDLFATGATAFEQLSYWRLYILFETHNDLNSNPEVLHQFVIYAYKKALVPLRYQWIIWHELAQYYLSYGNDEMAIKTYAESIEVLPKNLMLAFAYADLLESRKRASEAKEVYHRILKNAATVEDKTLAQIQYLKFVQRTEGPEAMRRDFVVALEKDVYTFHLLIAAAEIENAVNLNSEAAKRILRWGIKKYDREPVFIQEIALQYLNLDHIEGLIQIYPKIQILQNDRKLTLCRKLLDYFRISRDKCNGLISHMQIIIGAIEALREEFSLQDNAAGMKSVIERIKPVISELIKSDDNVRLISEFVRKINEGREEDEEKISVCTKTSEDYNIGTMDRAIDSDLANTENPQIIQNVVNQQFYKLGEYLKPIKASIEPIPGIINEITKTIRRIEDDLMNLDKDLTREKLVLESFFLPHDYR